MVDSKNNTENSTKKITVHPTKALEILIVDDYEPDQEMVRTLFKRSFACIIHTANSFSVAKEKILTHRFDIISLDGFLPCLVDGGKGHNLISFIIQHQKYSAPVIMMVSGESCYIKQGLEKGAHFGFSKEHIKQLVKLTPTFDLVPIVSKKLHTYCS